MSKQSSGNAILFDQLPLDAIELLDNISYGIIATDERGDIVFWNRAGKKIFGYMKGDMLGEHISKVITEEPLSEQEFDIEFFEDTQQQVHHWKARDKEGSTVWIDSRHKIYQGSGDKPAAIIFSCCEVDERKELEKNLEESRARYKAILDGTVEAIITINTEGEILTFNKAAEEIFGYKREEAIGRNVSLLMPEPHKKKHDDYINRYLETGEARIIGVGREERGQKKDGSLFPIELSISEIEIDGQQLFTGIIRDISRRRELENQILEISEDEKRTIGQDLHDGLGQMLTGIGLISNNLAKKLEANGVPGADEVRKIADMVKEADEYARTLSHGLVPIDLDIDGLRTAFNLLVNRVKRLFNIRCELEEEGIIEIHKQNMTLHLYRIAQEAVNNAVKHGNADFVKINLTGDTETLEMVIEDNGSGLKEPLEKLKKNGLGIRTMQYRAHMLGGDLTISEDQEGWTRVICKIPNHNITEE